jgi:hypothetical protein
LDDVDNTTNTWDGDMVARRWIMTEKGLKCIDCENLESVGGRNNDDDDDIEINSKGIKVNGEDAQIRINKDGIKIKTPKDEIEIKNDKKDTNKEDK